MPYSNAVVFEDLRSHAAAPGATYVVCGAAYTNRIVEVAFINNTNGDIVVTDDASVSVGKFYLTAGSYRVVDIRTNSANLTDLTGSLHLQFYVKDGTTASTTGNFYIEAISVRTLP
jgi:hypothetical protein